MNQGRYEKSSNPCHRSTVVFLLALRLLERDSVSYWVCNGSGSIWMVEELEIRQSLWSGRLVPPKTQGSFRNIYFGEHLRLVLMEHRQRSLHSSPDDFVFCKSDGSPLNPDILRRDVLYPALDRLGIPRSTRCAGFHTFRHSAATIVNAQTGNLKLVQKLLGHTNFGTTADVYTHTAADEDRNATVALERAIYGDLFPSVPKNANKNTATVVN